MGEESKAEILKVFNDSLSTLRKTGFAMLAIFGVAVAGVIYWAGKIDGKVEAIRSDVDEIKNEVANLKSNTKDDIKEMAEKVENLQITVWQNYNPATRELTRRDLIKAGYIKDEGKTD